MNVIHMTSVVYTLSVMQRDSLKLSGSDRVLKAQKVQIRMSRKLQHMDVTKPWTGSPQISSVCGSVTIGIRWVTVGGDDRITMMLIRTCKVKKNINIRIQYWSIEVHRRATLSAFVYLAIQEQKCQGFVSTTEANNVKPANHFPDNQLTMLKITLQFKELLRFNN